MSRAVPLLVAIPLMGAALSLLLVQRRVAQRVVAVACTTAGLALAVGLLLHVEREGTAAVARIGAWDTSIGITYVVDRLAAVMLVIGFATLLVVLVFAIGQRPADEATPYYHPAYLVLTAGVAAAFCAGDLFHLFVAFEVLLMASYVLLTLQGRPGQIRSGTTYVVINTVESMVLLAGVGLVYAATGTLSLADLPEALAALDPGARTGLHLLLLIAFGLKSAVFPLFFWLPDAYPTAPSPVTAVFAGLLTKIGVYCLIRTQTLLFPGELDQVLLWVAGLTMVIGVLGAIAQSDIKRILSFHIVSQIGYMVMGLAIGGPAAIAATVFFVIHQIPVKTSLFLVEGVVEHSVGTGTLDRIGGLARRSAPLALCFALPALSLAGLPPFSGFVGKLGLVSAGMDAGQYVVTGIALFVSILTLISMTKIWLGAFWGEALAPAEMTASGEAAASDEAGGILGRNRTMAGATIGLVAAGLALALAAGPIYRFCDRTADDLTTPGRWPWLVLLTVTWVLLQGELTVGNVLGGATASVIVLVAVPVAAEPRTHRIHPLGLVRYLGFVARSLVTSSLAVVRTSLVPTPARLRSGIVRCELPGASPLVTTLVANAITLTPGTLTVTADATADPAVLHVHVLGLGDIEGFRAEIADLHARARAAVTPERPGAASLPVRSGDAP